MRYSQDQPQGLIRDCGKEHTEAYACMEEGLEGLEGRRLWRRGIRSIVATYVYGMLIWTLTSSDKSVFARHRSNGARFCFGH